MRPTSMLVALLTACCCTFVPNVAGAEVALDVSPMVIELKGLPGSAQHGGVTIRNSGHTDETVSFAPISWSVTEYGEFSIDRQPVDPDRNITPYLAISQSRFVLKPGEARSVIIAATMPQTSARSYWGGYVVSVSDGAGGASAGATVVVYADSGPVARHLRFQQLDVGQAVCVRPAARTLTRPRSRGDVDAPSRLARKTTARPCLLAKFLNDSEGYCRTAARLSVAREEKGREPHVVIDQQVTVGAVLPGKTHSLVQPLDGLPPGRYALRLTLDYGSTHVVDAERSFTVR